MEIVADTSVLIAVIANEPEKGRIIAKTRGASLIAPSSVHWEIGNALSAMLKRRILHKADVKNFLSIYEKIAIQFVDVSLVESLELAADLRLYAYDAYLIQCSRQYRAPLMSLDRSLCQAAIKSGAHCLEVP